MISRRAFSSGLLASAATLATPLRAQGSQAPGRGAEVAALRAFAEVTHPRGREARADPDWQRRWAALERDAGQLSDGAYFIGIRRALGWFRDGHTTSLPFEFTGGVPAPLRDGPFALSLPFRARLFHDGAYVSAAGPEAKNLLGGRITRVGQLDAVSLARRSAEQWPGNPAWAQRWMASAFASPALLEGLGAVSDAAAPIAVETEGGRALLQPVRDGTAPRPIERPAADHERWAEQAGGDNYLRLLPEQRALYVSIDDMADTPGKTFEALVREIFAAMETPGLERIVIDLRRNGGGNNYLGEPLRRALAASRFNRPGGLYVLIGPATFSAAQNLANRLERETFAIFAGEPSGGAPNHYGDARPFTGEATGIVSIVSTLPWFDSYPQDEREWIMPDLPVPAVFADWRSGRDRVLAAVLAHRADGPGDELDRNRIFYFRRPSQSATWQPFWREAGAAAG